MAAGATELDDAEWLTQVSASQNHEEDHARELSDLQAAMEGEGIDLSRAICRALICATLVGPVPFDNARAALNYADSQILSGQDEWRIKELEAVAAAHYAATAYLLSGGEQKLFDWADQYHALAVEADQARLNYTVEPSPLRSARESFMGLLALMAEKPGRAKQLGELATAYAQAMQSNNGSVEYNALVEVQLDRARRLLELASIYPYRDSTIGDTQHTWHQTMRRLLGNPDMPDETNRQS